MTPVSNMTATTLQSEYCCTHFLDSLQLPLFKIDDHFTDLFQQSRLKKQRDVDSLCALLRAHLRKSTEAIQATTIQQPMFGKVFAILHIRGVIAL